MSLLGLAGAMLGAAVLLAVVGASLRPQPGEWAMQVSLPLSLPPSWRLPGWPQPLVQVRVQVGVPSLIRLATQPPIARALARRAWQVGPNRLQLQWHAADQRLRVDCAPCWLQHPALSAHAVQVKRLGADVQRHGETLQGRWWMGLADQAVQGSWRATLSQQDLRLHIALPATPIAHAYAALAAAMPEVGRARIGGQFSLSASVRLPEGRWQLQPELQAMQVSGLGTEALRQLPTHPLPWQHPLVRAVLAAEDQRFEQHPGFDVNEWQQVLSRAGSRDGGHDALRGASTITQQLAKLIYTDGERSALRKLRELLYAVEMEQTLGKARILQLYLAHAPWGAVHATHGAVDGVANAADAIVGAEAAARHYFGRPARQLTVAQSVWLAAMLNAPNRHARQWARSGHIDLHRAHWVAQRLRLSGRGLGPQAMQRVQLALAALQHPSISQAPQAASSSAASIAGSAPVSAAVSSLVPSGVPPAASQVNTAQHSVQYAHSSAD
jgi:hypothetical protein